MSTKVKYDLSEFQSNLPSLAARLADSGGHYVVTQDNHPAFVTIPYQEYQELLELKTQQNTSTVETYTHTPEKDPEMFTDEFRQSLEQAEHDIAEGNTISYTEFRKTLDLD